MTQKFSGNRSDRWADWAVIVTLVVALLLGAAVMTLAQGQHSQYTSAEAGLTVSYPQNWLLKSADDLAFQAVDPESSDFKTAYQVRVTPIVANTPTTSTLTLALSNLSLTRAQQEIAYRQLEINEGPAIGGQPAREATYVYVVKGNDLFVQRMPAIVQGLDIAVARGGRAYIFSLLAAKDTFPGAETAFRRFVASAEIK